MARGWGKLRRKHSTPCGRILTPSPHGQHGPCTLTWPHHPEPPQTKRAAGARGASGTRPPCTLRRGSPSGPQAPGHRRGALPSLKCPGVFNSFLYFPRGLACGLGLMISCESPTRAVFLCLRRKVYSSQAGSTPRPSPLRPDRPSTFFFA